ncbi:MAG TPA: spore germination protein [Thermoclostridium sp.]|nr:spore germination protein [Thermoclostridium sp.]
MKSIASYLKNILLFKPENAKKPFILDEFSENESSNNDSEEKQSGEKQDSENKSSNKESAGNNTEENQSSNKGASEDKPADNKPKDNGANGNSSSNEKAKVDGSEESTGIKNYERKKDRKREIVRPIPISTSEMNKKKDDKKPRKNNSGQDTIISNSISTCLEVIKKRYSADINGDFKLREFKVLVENKAYDAFVCFFDGMTDTALINSSILVPMMTLSIMPVEPGERSVKDIIFNHLIPQNQIKECKTYQEVVDEINFGGIGIFIDTLDVAFAADVKGWEHRSVEKPETEINIRGPRESFTESNRVNSALLRKILKDEDLIVEDVLVGVRSKTPCGILYIKSIANNRLVDEVRKRLQSIKIAYLRDAGELESLLEDDSLFPAPQMLLTERPDRVASYLSEGRVAIIVHGSPFVIVVPITLFGLLHSPEDDYLRFPYSTLLRLVRILGIMITLFLSAIYLAITTYHHEMIPTDLLLAIASSREKVPFPTVISLLIMEVSFELIREAGIRIPGSIGSTLSIVGALILGQAAVSANLVSPILIIVVAVTGLGSFTIPDFSLGYSLRALRFLYILLAYFAGLLGISLGLFLHILFLVDAKSFGVPFFVPFAPRTKGRRTNTIIKTPFWVQEYRPDFLNPKDIKQQPFISRGWVKSEKGVKADGRESENR